MNNTPITPATVNGQSYFRVPLPSGMCAFVKFEQEAQKLQTICNAHDALVAALRQCADLFSAIRMDYTDPRSECREGRATIEATLANAEGK